MQFYEGQVVTALGLLNVFSGASLRAAFYNSMKRKHVLLSDYLLLENQVSFITNRKYYHYL